MGPELAAAARRRYATLTAFRSSGVRVSTPVRLAPAGDTMVVRTASSSGAVKRLRNDPRMQLRECDRRGRVAAGAVVVEAVAHPVVDEAEQGPLLAAPARKHGWRYRALRTSVRTVVGIRGVPEAPILVLRITDPHGLGGS